MAKKNNRPLGMAMLLDAGAYSFVRERVFSVKELRGKTLKIDERYQRDELKPHVALLIRVIEQGGSIPDPIWVAERPDGSLWVVDGQQRCWAHWHTETPIRARIHKVSDWETERKIFHILNNRKADNSAHRAYTWPGPGGDLLRWLDENEKSALRSRIGQNTSTHMPASTIAKALVLAICGTHYSQGIIPTMQRLDALANGGARRAQKTAELLAVVLTNVFPKGKLLSLPARAIGKVAFDRWGDLRANQAWNTPSRQEYARLRRVNWRGVSPTQEHRWLSVVATEVSKRWKAA